MMTVPTLADIFALLVQWLADHGGKCAELGGANLTGANLLDADLRGADLGGANLGGANLRGRVEGSAD